MNKKIILICTPLLFCTQNDEELFFEWLKKVKCIEKYVGVGDELHLYILSKRITNNDLFELMGVFRRYNFDFSQLKIFMNSKNKEWFEE
jgi:hypothetical protein